MSHGLRILLVSLFAAAILGVVLPRALLRNVWREIKSFIRSLMAFAARRPKTSWLLIWLIALVPMVHLTWLVRQYGVEVPTLDDWEMAPLIVKAHSGQLPWADLFQQQQEARTVLPKLIFILSAAGGHWDVRDQMLFSVICCWLTAGGIFFLLRRSDLHFVASAICFWLMVITIFSPAQFELWLLASGFPSFLPALFLAVALAAIDTGLSTLLKFVICAALAVASSLTLPNGLLAWALTFPVLLLVRKVPRWPSWLAAWLLACALCSALYFRGYEKPGYLPTFAPAVSPVQYARFILEFLGGGLAYCAKDQPGAAAGIFGAFQLALFLAALVYCARRARDRAFLAKVMPWFVLGLYALGNSFLAALGRVQYGPDYALASRYVTFSLWLAIALIALVAIIGSEIAASRLPRARAWLWAIGVALLFSYLAPYKVGAANTRFFLRSLSAKDRLARGAVLFSPAFDTSQVIQKTAYPPEPGRVIQLSAALDALHLLRPPLVRTNRLKEMPHQGVDGNEGSGSCETLVEEGEFYRASGWALLNAKRRQADCVVIAYELPGAEPILFAISDAIVMRWEIARRFPRHDYLWAGWSAEFPKSAVPPGAKLSFWAVDADGPKLHQLRDDFSFNQR